MKNPDTEPEAAALRSALRQVLVILTTPPAPAKPIKWWQKLLPVQPEPRVAGATEVIRRALKRPRTNGGVIDELERENGDLRSAVIDLEIELKMVKGGG